MLKSAGVSLVAVLAVGCSGESQDTQGRTGLGSLPVDRPVVTARWYTQAQVRAGAELFRENCAGCHGPEASGTPNWQQRDAEGRLPPPPLDGTAHAWHHPRSVLRRVVREGGQKLGGSMPGFQDKLSPEQIDQVIAWVQSNWNEETYQRWQKIDQESRVSR